MKRARRDYADVFDTWPVMYCITEHAFADPTFDLMKLALVNKNWREAVDLFVKRISEEDTPRSNVSARAVRDSLYLVRAPPHGVLVDFIAFVGEYSVTAAKRLMDRFNEELSCKRCEYLCKIWEQGGPFPQHDHSHR